MKRMGVGAALLIGVVCLAIFGSLACNKNQTPKIDPQLAIEQIDQADSDFVYHFAYGSNLQSKYLRKFAPSATPLMAADLPNYHIEFRYYSKNLKGGISTIIEAPGKVTHGVIYAMVKEDLTPLDENEGVPDNEYKRETFLVYGADGKWHNAELYRIVKPEGPFTPAKKYVGWMIEGAEEHNLSPEYIEELKELKESL